MSQRRLQVSRQEFFVSLPLRWRQPAAAEYCSQKESAVNNSPQRAETRSSTISLPRETGGFFNFPRTAFHLHRDANNFVFVFVFVLGLFFFRASGRRQRQGQSQEKTVLRRRRSRKGRGAGGKTKKMNEWVCCNSSSHAGTIITIHQDNK